MAACQLELLAGCQVHSATSMGLVEGEFPLTWFLTNALLSKPEMKVRGVYTWRGDTAEGVWISPGQYMTTWVYFKKKKPTPPIFLLAVAAILFLKDPTQKLIRSSKISREQLYEI